MRPLLLLVFLALTSNAAYSQNTQPLEIKGFWLGMPKASAVELGNLQCGLADGRFASTCMKSRAGGNEATETIAGVPTIAFHANILSNDTVGGVYITFAASDFSKVRQAVANKYRNLKCRNSTVSNRMGATFDQVDCELEQRNGVLSLTKRAGDVDTGLLMLMSEQQMKENRAEENEQTKKAKSDI